MSLSPNILNLLALGILVMCVAISFHLIIKKSLFGIIGLALTVLAIWYTHDWLINIVKGYIP